MQNLISYFSICVAIFPLVAYGFSPLKFSKNAYTLRMSLFDEEDDDGFRRIAFNYLSNKYKSCSKEECRVLCDKNEVENMLRQVLPPVSKEEIEKEVKNTMSKFKGDLVEESLFIEAIMGNSYWAEAGPLVVKELIFLDTLHSYYEDKKQILDDTDYNELKEALTWEGSMAVTVTGDEAKFISAVAAYRRGLSQMDNSEYERLKSSLQATSSWVVQRGQDPLEKLGLKTFLGYLHRGMNS